MSANKANCMKVSTPQILWHGGANENGKPDPVYSVDFHPTQPILATAGVDGNMPANGCARLWSMKKDQEYIMEMNDHITVVNILRFSPCGKMLATASERQIVIYVETSHLDKIRLTAAMHEVYDLAWSPCAQYILVGSMDGKSEVIHIHKKDSIMLPNHTSYVQGVAWDPKNRMLVTQSADRSVRVHQVKFKDQMIRLATKGHHTLRTLSSPAQTSAASSSPPANLFLDCCNVHSFFRRASFTPDGNFIIAPTGVCAAPSGLGQKSYATHVFHRDHLQMPFMSLAGLPDPSVAVRCSPVLYKPLPSASTLTPWRGLPYRMVMAVCTLHGVYVYDTQHLHPICMFTGHHYAPINDAAWSGDGNRLVVCSSDGYVTIVTFQPGALGEVLEDDQVPETVRTTHPCLYHSSPISTTSAATAAAVAVEESEESDASESENEAVPLLTTVPSINKTVIALAKPASVGLNQPSSQTSNEASTPAEPVKINMIAVRKKVPKPTPAAAPAPIPAPTPSATPAPVAAAAPAIEKAVVVDAPTVAIPAASVAAPPSPIAAPVIAMPAVAIIKVTATPCTPTHEQSQAPLSCDKIDPAAPNPIPPANNPVSSKPKDQTKSEAKSDAKGEAKVEVKGDGKAKELTLSTKKRKRDEPVVKGNIASFFKPAAKPVATITPSKSDEEAKQTELEPGVVDLTDEAAAPSSTSTPIPSLQITPAKEAKQESLQVAGQMVKDKLMSGDGGIADASHVVSPSSPPPSAMTDNPMSSKKKRITPTLISTTLH
eukprot:gene35564-43127_t